MKDKLVQFLVDMGASYSILTSQTRSLAPETSSIARIKKEAKTKTFNYSSNLQERLILNNSQFLVMAECPSPLLGRNFSLSLGGNSYSL